MEEIGPAGRSAGQFRDTFARLPLAVEVVCTTTSTPAGAADPSTTVLVRAFSFGPGGSEPDQQLPAHLRRLVDVLPLCRWLGSQQPKDMPAREGGLVVVTIPVPNADGTVVHRRRRLLTPKRLLEELERLPLSRLWVLADGRQTLSSAAAYARLRAILRVREWCLEAAGQRDAILHGCGGGAGSGCARSASRRVQPGAPCQLAAAALARPRPAPCSQRRRARGPAPAAALPAGCSHALPRPAPGRLRPAGPRVAPHGRQPGALPGERGPGRHLQPSRVCGERAAARRRGVPVSCWGDGWLCVQRGVTAQLPSPAPSLSCSPQLVALPPLLPRRPPLPPATCTSASAR